jgi:biopolymer transport protein ExbD
MNRIFFRAVVVVLSFGLGIATAVLLKRQNPNKSVLPDPPATLSVKCPSASDLMARGKYVVIAVPSDREFYIGKSSVALSDIPERVRSLTANESPDDRIIFIKGEPSVRYETLSSVISKVKDANVSRIEIVPNKKKS